MKLLDAEKVRISPQYFPFMATAFTFLLLLVVASLRYTGFFSAGVLINLLDDNAFLGIAAIGMTFVILSGGIDLSVGSMIGLTSVALATLIERQHVHPALAIPLVLAMGGALGGVMGALIRFFALAPFLVTLAGMFLIRGLALLISMESIQLTHPIYSYFSSLRVSLGSGAGISGLALIFLATLAAATWISIYSSFGRNVYAIGGSEPSATLMGLPVGRTKVTIYIASGFCSALAGVIYSFYTSSGNATAGGGLELDAIAAVVIGGTLLTGGSGYVLGTFLGVLILGLIQTAVTFENTLSSWWTRISIGALLFCFVLIQRFATPRRE